jgi:hypothetical protein
MKLLALLAFLAFLVLLSGAQPTAPPSGGKCPAGYKLEDEQKFQSYTVRIYRGGDAADDAFDGCLRILKDGRVIFAKNTDTKFAIGDDINKGSDDRLLHPPSIPVGTDITGLGKPDLIVSEWTGGAHCCFIFHVIELDEPIREIASIDAEDADYAHFEDVDRDGVYEFLGWDLAFKYWRTSFAQSPAPQIILRFDGTRYKLAPDLMRKAAPSTEQLRKIETDIGNEDAWKQGSPPPKFWGTMLDLIYSGHADEAWKFADEAWGSANESKSRFLSDFCEQLATSPYFEDLRPTITKAPCKFPAAPKSSNH